MSPHRNIIRPTSCACFAYAAASYLNPHPHNFFKIVQNPYMQAYSITPPRRGRAKFNPHPIRPNSEFMLIPEVGTAPPGQVVCVCGVVVSFRVTGRQSVSQTCESPPPPLVAHLCLFLLLLSIAHGWASVIC